MSSTVRRLLAAAAGMAAALFPFVPASAAPAPAYGGYAMAYFTESPTMAGANYGLHLAVSHDGLNWTPLNRNEPVATPTEGTLGFWATDP